MQNKSKKNSKTLKVFIILIVVIALIGISIYFIINAKHATEEVNSEDTSLLKGTFIYSENVKYEFNGKGKGAMYDRNSKYDYTYTIENENIMMDFKNEALRDATYTYKLEDDTLTLIGGEGTTGGKYILKKEN